MPTNRSRAVVDPDQRDPSKAVNRDERASAADDPDMSPSEKRALTWLDKDKGVKARIGRFQRSMQSQFDQERAGWEAEKQRTRRDIEQLQKLARSNSEHSASTDEAAHNRAMDDLQNRIAAAHEAGNSADVAKLTREMSQKEAAFIDAKTRALMGQASEREEPPAAAAPAQNRRPTDEGNKFTQANALWWNDPESLHIKRFANGLHEKLIADGSDPASPKHYQKIAAEVAKRFPEIEVEGVPKKRKAAQAGSDEEDPEADPEEESEEDEEEDDPPPPRRAAVQNFRDRGHPVRNSRRGVALTDDDYATMRAVGLDPDNDKHLVQFAREKRQTEADARNL